MFGIGGIRVDLQQALRFASQAFGSPRAVASRKAGEERRDQVGRSIYNVDGLLVELPHPPLMVDRGRLEMDRFQQEANGPERFATLP